MRQSSINYNQETERLEARISADKKKLLKNAAALSGRTLTDFVVSASYETAIRVIQEYQQLHLTSADRDVFIRALLKPPSVSTRLLKAAQEYKQDVESR